MMILFLGYLVATLICCMPVSLKAIGILLWVAFEMESLLLKYLVAPAPLLVERINLGGRVAWEFNVSFFSWMTIFSKARTEFRDMSKMLSVTI